MTIKYLLAGISSYFIYSIFLIIGVEIFGINEAFNNAISYGITFFYSFFLAKNWVFKTERKLTNTFQRYSILAIVNYLINITGFGIILFFYNLHYMFVQIIMVVFVTIFSYFIQRFWVFDKKINLNKF